MNKARNILKSKAVVLLLVFALIAPNLIFIKNAHAFLGIGDFTFNVTLGDIPQKILQIGEKIANVFLEKYRKRLVTMFTNDIINFVQNNEKPRFIQNPKKFLKNAADQAAGQAINEIFKTEGLNVCSPFKVSLNILANRVRLLPERRVECTLGDIVKNLDDFGENFNNGGWKAWLALHEEANTLPGTYIQTRDIVNAKISAGKVGAMAALTTDGGFLGTKVCTKTTYVPLVGYYTGDAMEMDLIRVGLKRNGGNWDKYMDEIVHLEADNVEGLPEADYKMSKLFYPNPEVLLEYTYPKPIDTQDLVTQLYESCKDEKTVTPGKIIADQLSGVLQKTGIDNLVSADSLTQFLNMLIDAAVNRVLNEGLSYVKTGHGAFWKPQTGGGPAKTTSNIIKEQPGMEAPKAIAIQNQIFDLSNESQKALVLIDKLTSREGKVKNLEKRLDDFKSVINPNLTGSDKNKDTAVDVIDRLYYIHHISYIPDMAGARKVDFEPRIDFNVEENNPGAYLANQLLHRKLADLWEEIGVGLEDLKNNDVLSGKCILDLKFALNPEENSLPFLAGQEDVNWAVVGDTDTYIEALYKSKDFDKTWGSDWKKADGSLEYMITKASQMQTREDLMADAYDGLIENAKAQIEWLDENLKYTSEEAHNINLYASILLDYDRAGATTTIALSSKIKNYQDALAGRFEISVADARAVLGPVEVPIEMTEMTDDTALKVAKKQLKVARNRTGIQWAQDQRDKIAALLTPSRECESEECKKAEKKLLIIANEVNPKESAIALIGSSIIDSATSSPEQAFGLSPSDAVAKIMQELDDPKKPGNKLLPQPIDQLLEEVERRAGDVTKLSTELSNTLGEFPTDTDERQRLEINGGDSEWEKYFYNRFQFAYAGFIYDFFARELKNRILDKKWDIDSDACPKPGP